jgi:CPA2 family monovalent cation:H+ antiporter-2
VIANPGAEALLLAGDRLAVWGTLEQRRAVHALCTKTDAVGVTQQVPLRAPVEIDAC